jgi:hypothetical protein
MRVIIWWLLNKIQIVFESLGAREEFRASLKAWNGERFEGVGRNSWFWVVFCISVGCVKWNCFGTAGSTGNLLYSTSNQCGMYIYHSRYVKILVCFKSSAWIMEIWTYVSAVLICSCRAKAVFKGLIIDRSERYLRRLYRIMEGCHMIFH